MNILENKDRKKSNLEGNRIQSQGVNDLMYLEPKGDTGQANYFENKVVLVFQK